MLFVDNITFFSLLRLWALSRPFDTIWHFEPLSTFSRRLITVYRRLGLLRAEISQITHQIGQVRNQSDDNEADDMEYIKIMGEVRAICSRIKQEQLSKHPLINAMSSIWSVQRVALHFERLAEREITTELVRIALVDWVFRNRSSNPAAKCIVLLEKKQWYSYVKPYARSQGIKIISYRNPWKLAPLSKVISLCMASFLKLLTSPFRILRGKLAHESDISLESRPKAQAQSKETANAPTVAIRYWFRTLDLDPTKRSEFFWLNESGIPYSDILLYDYVSDKPLDEEIKSQIESHGIKILGRGPGVDPWRPTIGMFSVFLGVTLKLTRELLSNALRFRWVSFYYVATLLHLASRYAYWYDFYRTNGIRVDVAVTHASVAQVLALDSLGGVSMAYQYSVGGFYPTTMLTCGENVQFVFSPLFERQYRDVEAPVDSFVPSGFIYDSAIQGLRSLDRIAEVRKQISDCGATFTLCFFDENSASSWYTPSSHEQATADYEFLLQWLLSDPTLGLVFKPKNSTNLFERISSLSNLIDQARDTGRCYFLTAENLYGSVYPAEAALLADVCIGKLTGVSAALEGRLTGVPTLLINTEQYCSHPFYSWGHDRIIFDDWVSLRETLERFRKEPESYTEFGDWSPIMDDLDPFRDGRAAERMGTYIKWLLEGLQAGLDRETAMAQTGERYCASWGHDNVIVTNPRPGSQMKTSSQAACQVTIDG